jgi:hypothetical protein
LIDLTKEKPDKLDVICVRPGGVTHVKHTALEMVIDRLVQSIRVDQLAAVMTELLIKGSEKQILENEELLEIAKRLS